MASRGRVTAYLPEEIQKALEEWAEEDSRSVSSLATYLLTKSGLLDKCRKVTRLGYAIVRSRKVCKINR
ncbi:ribbon-helix-helix domain-containing protein [Microcoleus sp. MON2_D5]|uniref:ribbon-helix-helix domain-containing protein n=1 Tax=Microcoleus sp. MON2_D5 TaxID=2818833 RepID=UPI002FD0C872